MKNQFTHFIDIHGLCKQSDRVLLAVSGGIDSVVMLDLFLKSGYENLGLVHCNFMLRGSESDADEEFVINLASRHNIPLFTKHFNTKAVAKEQKISIQMAARELRYNWFSWLLDEHKYDHLALAHQADDITETFFINLIRGTGIKGLAGIQNKSGKKIRPLLFATRRQIEAYAIANNIIFREDSSNQETKYIRNKLRHEIIPSFKTVNPGFDKTMHANVAHLHDALELYTRQLEYLKRQIIVKTTDAVMLQIEEITRLRELSGTVLLEILREFGFNRNDLPDILHALTGESGRTFYSKTHRLIKDREALIITELGAETSSYYYVEEDNFDVEVPIRMTGCLMDMNPSLDLKRGGEEAFFDYEQLEFPLILRKWHHGEYFVPFGMDNFKKVSDFFIDKKLSIFEKEKAWILASGGKIVWIVGMRSDNRFRVTERTNEILHLKLLI
jgi:tRNA(Ile)-lysidine synthase